MKYILTTLTCTLLLLSFSGCKNTSTTEAEETPINLPESLPGHFVEFYKQFHQDSVFQMAHIQWPLKGIPDRQLAEGEEFSFQPAKWKLQKAIDPASGYASEFVVFTEALIQENIINKSNNTHLIRRFLYQQGSWNLIYYQGVRQME